MIGIDRFLLSVDDIIVDAVFQVRTGIHIVREQTCVVGFVVGKEQRHLAAVAIQKVFAEERMFCPGHARPAGSLHLPEDRFFGRPGLPGSPIVAVP
jgi:hypothetical protein